jgi:hypothetical protein
LRGYAVEAMALASKAVSSCCLIFACMEIWAAIISLVGVALGWALTQTSAWLATRQADHRIIKEVLYLLLELHRLLAVLERVDAFLDSLTEQIKQHSPVSPEEKAQLQKIIRNTVTPLVGQQLTTLKESYNASLLKLASVDPVSAYRLRGQEDIIHKVPQFVSAMQAAGAGNLEGVPFSVMTDFLHEALQADDIRDTKALVWEIIEHLAKQVDKATAHGLAALKLKASQQEQTLPSQVDVLMQKAKVAFPAY